MNPKITQVRLKGHDAITDELGDIIEIWTPNEIKTYVYMVMSAYESMARDVIANKDKLSQEFIDSWSNNFNGFMRFVKSYDDAGWLTRTSMGPVRTAERFTEILNGYREKYTSETGNVPSQKTIVNPSDAQKEFFASIGGAGKWIIGGICVLGGAYIIGKLVDRFPAKHEGTV
jgi:hypothetical protein